MLLSSSLADCDWWDDDSARRYQASEDSAETGECGLGSGFRDECRYQSSGKRAASLTTFSSIFQDTSSRLRRRVEFIFKGRREKYWSTPQNGLIQVPSKIDNKKYNLALDLGSSISFLSDELFEKLASAGNLPQMTGAVGSANMWGADEETKWKVMRVNRVQYGPLFLTDVAMVELPKSTVEFFEKRAGVPTVGLMGGNVFLNYRVGLDYAHSMAYFDIGRMFNFPDFDVVGLILRPEDDGRYLHSWRRRFRRQAFGSIGADGIQAGDYLVAVDGIPVRGSTMGQVWAMLGGTPGKERRITIERAGKQSTVLATVQHFLGALPDSDEKKKKK